MREDQYFIIRLHWLLMLSVMAAMEFPPLDQIPRGKVSLLSMCIHWSSQNRRGGTCSDKALVSLVAVEDSPAEHNSSILSER